MLNSQDAAAAVKAAGLKKGQTLPTPLVQGAHLRLVDGAALVVGGKAWKGDLSREDLVRLSAQIPSGGLLLVTQESQPQKKSTIPDEGCLVETTVFIVGCRNVQRVAKPGPVVKGWPNSWCTPLGVRGIVRRARPLVAVVKRVSAGRRTQAPQKETLLTAP